MNQLVGEVERCMLQLSEYADSVVIVACNNVADPAEVSYRFRGNKFEILGHMHTAMAVVDDACLESVGGMVDENDKDE